MRINFRGKQWDLGISAKVRLGTVCTLVFFFQSAQAGALSTIRPQNFLLCTRVADQSAPVIEGQVLETFLIGKEVERQRPISVFYRSLDPENPSARELAVLASSCTEANESLRCQIQTQPFDIGLRQRDRFILQLAEGQSYVCLIK